MNIYIAVTDNTWFNNLRYMQDLDEVNFWQPGGKSRFRAISEGELFLFKLHSPHDFIAGGGVFFYSNILPVSLAWQAFEEKNGAASLLEMWRLIENYRGEEPTYADYEIGCIILTQPFFWSEDQCTNVLMWFLGKMPSCIFESICDTANLSVGKYIKDNMTIYSQYLLEKSIPDAIIEINNRYIVIETKLYPNMFKKSQFVNHFSGACKKFGLGENGVKSKHFTF